VVVAEIRKEIEAARRNRDGSLKAPRFPSTDQRELAAALWWRQRISAAGGDPDKEDVPEKLDIEWAEELEDRYGDPVGEDILPDGSVDEYRFSAPDGRPFWLAGLCSWAEPAEGRTFTFTMVTKEPGGDTASIKHHRQPVNLRPDQLALWLDPSVPLAEFKGVSALGTFKVEPAKSPEPA